MYKYFVPDEPDGERIKFVSDEKSLHSRGDIVPLYDEGGTFIATFFIYLFLFQPMFYLYRRGYRVHAKTQEADRTK
jgi:hypothetical protein